MLSDHGNNRDNGKTFDVQKWLQMPATIVTFSLRGNRDVVNPKVGVINYGLCSSDQIPQKILQSKWLGKMGKISWFTETTAFAYLCSRQRMQKAPLESPRSLATNNMFSSSTILVIRSLQRADAANEATKTAL